MLTTVATSMVCGGGREGYANGARPKIDARTWIIAAILFELILTLFAFYLASGCEAKTATVTYSVILIEPLVYIICRLIVGRP